ncbi:CNOT2 isoform 19 [Pongo abelii]|uniref:CNOT2 isoform 13 n=1 Tax=Pongo abelii TaxID=9601 RepID=A0A2J8W187_PONAB|nr:CNOT2 isoform 13 [Pongo abelii]PNJ63527.1 CNOT2 isoform 19 [Pongo abelii]
MVRTDGHTLSEKRNYQSRRIPSFIMFWLDSFLTVCWS